MELIEEEKEAIKTLKKILKEWQKIIDIEDPIERDCEMSCYMEDMPFYQIKILLKLVEKQQKEIDRLDKKLEREEQYEDYYEGLCKRQQEAIEKQQKEIKELKGYTKVTGRVGGMTSE